MLPGIENKEQPSHTEYVRKVSTNEDGTEAITYLVQVQTQEGDVVSYPSTETEFKRAQAAGKPVTDEGQE